MKASNSQRLVQEYQALVAGLTDQGILQRTGTDTILANPVLPDDIMQVDIDLHSRLTQPLILISRLGSCSRKYSKSRTFCLLFEKDCRVFQKKTQGNLSGEGWSRSLCPASYLLLWTSSIGVTCGLHARPSYENCSWQKGSSIYLQSIAVSFKNTWNHLFRRI